MGWKKSLLVAMYICVLAGCMVYYITQLAAAKLAYRQELISQTALFLRQQEAFMQRLSKQLLQPLRAQDQTQISFLLRAFEDQNFVLAKQGLTVPVTMQWVSLNAPQKIINSNGAAEAQSLAQDEQYYLDAIAVPDQLSISKAYTKAEMPEHKLVNFGFGILDAEHKYFGQLDASVSLAAIRQYIDSQINLAPQLFSYKLYPPNLLEPEIILHTDVYLREILYFMALSLVILSSIYLIIIYSYKIIKHYQLQRQELINKDQQINRLEHALNMLKNAYQTQFRYGILCLEGTTTSGHIDLQQLLQDVQAVNAELALLRNIAIKFPSLEAQQIKIHGDRLRLMQILSGILYEILQQLPSNSTVTLQVSVKELSDRQRKIDFKFIDDGFYSALQERYAVQSSADVRAKGWQNIKALIAAENGELQHEHTAYSGNTICFSLTQKVFNNVVSLESYLEEA